MGHKRWIFWVPEPISCLYFHVLLCIWWGNRVILWLTGLVFTNVFIIVLLLLFGSCYSYHYLHQKNVNPFPKSILKSLNTTSAFPQHKYFWLEDMYELIKNTCMLSTLYLATFLSTYVMLNWHFIHVINYSDQLTCNVVAAARHYTSMHSEPPNYNSCFQLAGMVIH